MEYTQSTFALNSLPGRTALIDGREWLYFSGTNYLGIVQDEVFKDLLGEGISRYGVHFGGSRLSNIQLPIFEQAEFLLSQITGAEAAITVTSGTLAGRMVLQLFGNEYIKCHAPGAHPAIQDYGKFSAFYEQWLDDVLELVQENSGQTLVILSNSIDPLHACQANFSWIAHLPDNLPIVLVIDDSHGFGITGRDGGGIATELTLPDNISLIVISSLGKALGIPGGVIMGPQAVIRSLWELPLFGGASPISPAYLYAFVNGQSIYRTKRQQLSRNIHYFNQGLEKDIFQHIDNFPVYYTPRNELSAYLERSELMISSFPYPTINDEMITRIVLNGMHTTDDIEILASRCLNLFQGVDSGVIPLSASYRYLVQPGAYPHLV